MENTDDTKQPSAKDQLVQMTKKANSKIRAKQSMEDLNSTELAAFINQYKPMISQSIVKHLTPERMIQMVTNLMVKNPELKKCTPQSLVAAVMQASELGFKPVQVLGECYFVPYNRNVGTKAKPQWVKEIQFQIGYKGYISLARRSGEIKTLYAYCVYEGDHFDYELGLNPQLKHKPSEQAKSFDKITHVYGVAHYKDGGYNFLVASKAEIEKLRLRNRSQGDKTSGAWATDYDKMACAKIIKQLAKYMPLSDEMQKAVAMDENIPNMEQITVDGTDLNALNYDFEDAIVEPQNNES